MLSHLTIENFGLIDRVEIGFEPQLNILTGSTGAGKSIIIDGLRFVLGERLNSSQIRDSQKTCTIEAVFEIADAALRSADALRDFFAEKDETSLIINRQYLPDGKTRIRVNGFTVTVSQLKALGDHLIDFHGPHDHQMLLAGERHLGILDQLSDFGDARETYEAHYREYLGLQKELQTLQELSSSRERDLELLSHQIQELEQVELSEEKYAIVAEERLRVNNAERLYEQAAALRQILEGEDGGLSETVRKAFTPLRALVQTDEKTASLETYLAAIQDNSQSLLGELRDYLDSLSFSPDDAARINNAFDCYEDIKRKYGPSLADAQKFFDEAREKHRLLADFETNEAGLQQRIRAAELALKKDAQKLTAVRKKTALALKKTIETELKDLGMEHISFEARLEEAGFHPGGQDQVTFYISPNAGEDLKPLAEIVSSGEAARLMLALKKALIKVDPIPVLVFDEIDAQIGGRLGTVTGKKLKELSRQRQVLLITHLPQIASFADAHFKVIKSVAKGRTVTTILPLGKEEKVKELAEMMSGKSQSEISLSHAESMLSSAEKNRG